MKKNTIKPQTAKFISLSDIVPKDWESWFYTAISEDAPFSWGDNNRTLVDAISFGHHAQHVLDMEESFGSNTGRDSVIKGRKKFFSTLNEMAEKYIYVDLEN